LDPAEQLNRRIGISGLAPETLSKIQTALLEGNELAKKFVWVGRSPDLRNMSLILRCPGNIDVRRYNLPTVDEIAMLIPDGQVEGRPRDIILRYSPELLADGRSALRRISELHPLYDSVSYPLLLTRGEPGWEVGIPKYLKHSEDLSGKDVSCRSYYAFRIQIRPEEGSMLHRAGALFHQYLVDMWVKVEAGRLSFIRQNQEKIRADLYQAAQDAFRDGERNAARVGRLTVLPATFSGSPRDMVNQYQDAMSIVQRFGKPDLFLTVTCNPKWREISDCLFPGQVAADRPDVVARVFNLKLQEILHDILSNHIFGVVISYVYSIEFQKRGKHSTLNRSHVFK
jgi:hypothetical protein